jgi:hypothetical protein
MYRGFCNLQRISFTVGFLTLDRVTESSKFTVSGRDSFISLLYFLQLKKLNLRY